MKRFENRLRLNLRLVELYIELELHLLVRFCANGVDEKFIAYLKGERNAGRPEERAENGELIPEGLGHHSLPCMVPARRLISRSKSETWHLARSRSGGAVSVVEAKVLGARSNGDRAFLQNKLKPLLHP